MTAYILIPLPHALRPLLLLLLSCILILLPSHHPHISKLFPHPHCTLLELLVHAHQHQGVVDEAAFDVPIEGSIGREGGSVVNLEQDRLHVFIYDYIETQQFETHITSEVLGLAGTVLELEVGMSADDGLHDEVLNLAPKIFDVDSFFLHNFKNRLQVAFVADAHVLLVLVEDEFV